LRQLLIALPSPTQCAGNAIFWTSFCILGQPLCMLLYAHEHVKREAAAALAQGVPMGPIVPH